MTKVKICGITNLEDALLSVKFGTDMLGFNFYEKSPRYITPIKAREIIDHLPENLYKVGVFVNATPESILEISEIARIDAVQLHGDETREFVGDFKTRTGLDIIKAFRIGSDFKPEDILQYESDAILLDAFSDQEYGGTGETIDFEVAHHIIQTIPKTYLAGGLKHETIATNIQRLKPFAVDVCSSIESEKGKKDKTKLINFLSKALFHRTLPDSIKSLFDLLQVFQPRLEMYIHDKSLTVLWVYLQGFRQAMEMGNSNIETNGIFSGEFEQWVASTLGYGFPNSLAWSEHILRACGHDETKAVDLFFALLEEYKMDRAKE